MMPLSVIKTTSHGCGMKTYHTSFLYTQGRAILADGSGTDDAPPVIPTYDPEPPVFTDALIYGPQRSYSWTSLAMEN